MGNFRRVAKSFLSTEQREGVGALVRRSIGGKELPSLDPFLLLDEFSVRKPAGFPTHPHRGFETVTYMLSGKFQHEDFCGHTGTITAGGLQWMTAGKGIVHSEMPDPEGGENTGLQLWINLAAKDKMSQPRYQELSASEVNEASADGIKARIIAGEALGSHSHIRTLTPATYVDFSMNPHRVLEHNIPMEYNAFAYVLSGSALFDDQQTCGAHQIVIFERNKGDHIRISTQDQPVRFVLIAGLPLNEPIARRGPFVMNTEQEVMQAYSDYQYGRNGFENAPGWKSKISH